MKTIFTIIALCLLSGCAIGLPNGDYSLIDQKGIDMATYNSDYADCAALANQTDVGGRAAGSAAAGALIGALLGGMFCGRNCARDGAAAGMVSAGIGGAGSGVQEQQGALRRCLAGRGYRVIR